MTGVRKMSTFMYMNGPNKQNQFFITYFLTTNVLAMACMPFTTLLQVEINDMLDNLFQKSTFLNDIVALMSLMSYCKNQKLYNVHVKCPAILTLTCI